VSQGEHTDRPTLDLRVLDLLAMLRLQHRVVIGALVICCVIGGGLHVLATPKYTATASVHLTAVTGQELKVDKVVDMDVYNRVDRKFFTETQILFMESRSLREAVIRKYQEVYGYDDLPLDDGGPGRLASMMSVKARRNSEVIDVRVVHPDPERAAVLANLVVETYMDGNLSSVRERARDATAWLDGQITRYEDEIVKASAKLFAYQIDNDLGDAEQDVTALAAKLDALNRGYGETYAESVQLAATVRTYETLFGRGDYQALAKIARTSLIVSLTDEWGELVTGHAAAVSRYGEQHPERQRLSAELEAIRSELEAEVSRFLQGERARLRVMEAREADLFQEVGSVKGEFLTWQEVHEDYERLKVALERAKSFYRQLMERKDELSLSSETQLSNVRVVDAARAPGTPTSPSLRRTLLVSVGGGLALGALLGIGRELFDDTFSTPGDVETWLRVPVLGTIPHVAAEGDTAQAMYTLEHSGSAAAEAVRGIRTVLDMSPQSSGFRRLLVSSATASEGKTTTAVRLAIAFATLGRRVVLVDADLRRPQLHRIFSQERANGLTDVLDGAEAGSVIEASGVTGLDLITAGTGGRRGVERLNSTEMTTLLETLDTLYDVVVIDTPPAGVVSDAAVLCRQVDGVVFVVRGHEPSRVAVRSALEGLEQVGASVFGVVLNAIERERTRAAGYHYAYAYRYSPYEESEAAK
jgi:capsular exopolysaccharide synthesis family protein